MGFGDNRRKSVAALESTSDLDPIESPESIDDLIEALEAIEVDRVRSPPQKPIDRLRTVYNQLDDEEAQREYIRDQTLLRRINAARREFNRWKGRELRSKRIPSWAEAGPSKYNHGKAQKKARYARESSLELDEKLDKVRAAANGARGRALDAIGTSVAEQNELEAEATREAVREKLEVGMIVQFRNPTLTVGRVKRVNKKTVTIEYEHGFTEDRLTGEELDPLTTARADLDKPQWLTILDADTIEEGKREVADDE